MVEGAELWRQLLRVEEPWSVAGFEADPVRRRYEVVIGLATAQGWFTTAQDERGAVERLWRHVNFGDWAISVRVMAPPGSNLSGLPWAGPPGLPFTHLLSQEIFSLLRLGLSTEAVAGYMRLSHDELWRFRHALDAGHWLPPLDQETALTDEALPSLSSPIWLGLLDGSREIDVKLLSLKLMLTKLRTQLAGNPGEATRALTVQELYGYFVRNKRSLEHEIAQLREDA